MPVKLINYVLIFSFQLFIVNSIYAQHFIGNEKKLFEDLDIISFKGYVELKTLKKHQGSYFLVSEDSIGRKTKIDYFNKKKKKAKKSWVIYDVGLNKIMVSSGSRMPGCQYLDSSVNLTDSLLVLRNCMDHLGNVKFQKISFIKKLSKDSIQILSFHLREPWLILDELINQPVSFEAFSYNTKIKKSITLRNNELSSVAIWFDGSGNFIHTGKREIEIGDRSLFIILHGFY